MPWVLLSLALLHYEMDNYGLAAESFTKLSRIEPNLAETFSYLGSNPIGEREKPRELSSVIWVRE